MRRLYRSCLRFGRDFSATACGTVRRGRAELARAEDGGAYAYQPLGLAEARPPPYFRSVTRLKPNRQVELFEKKGSQRMRCLFCKGLLKARGRGGNESQAKEIVQSLEMISRMGN
jgi:hypothetical protein